MGEFWCIERHFNIATGKYGCAIGLKLRETLNSNEVLTCVLRCRYLFGLLEIKMECLPLSGRMLHEESAY